MAVRSLGQLTIDVVAKIGGFEKGMDEAERKAARTAAQIERDQKKRAAEVRKAWENAGTFIGGAFVTAAAGFAVLTRSAINSLDALNDVADATGATIENISALEDVALRTGTNLENVNSILIKFNSVLKEAEPDKGAGAVLKALNLDIERLKQLDPAEALRQTAVALSQYANDGNKARAFQELFGKSVKDAAPFLNDLAEQAELAGTATAQAAKEAEIFNKQLFEFNANLQAVIRSFAGDFITAINRAAKAYRESGLFSGVSTLFSGDEKFKLDKRLVELTNQLLNAENELAKSRSIDSQFGDRSLRTASAEKRLAAIRAEIDQVQKLRGAYEQVGKAAEVANAPSLNVIEKKKEKETKEKISEAERFIESLKRQLQATKDLSVLEETIIELQNKKYATILPSQKEEILNLAKQIDLARQLKEQEKERWEIIRMRRESIIAEGEAVEKANEEYQRLVQGLVDQTPLAQLQKQEEAMQALAHAFAYGQITSEQYNQALDKLLENQNKKIKEQKSLAEELGLSFSSAFEDAIVSGKAFSDVLKGLAQDIMRIVTRKLVTEPLGNALTSMFSGAFGGFFGGGRAAGGSVMPNRLYEVNENGPEMLEMGGRQYLMMGNQAGRVVPTSQAKGGNTINVNVTAVPGVTRDTALQQGARIGTGIQLALARNT